MFSLRTFWLAMDYTRSAFTADNVLNKITKCISCFND